MNKMPIGTTHHKHGIYYKITDKVQVWCSESCEWVDHFRRYDPNGWKKYLTPVCDAPEDFCIHLSSIDLIVVGFSG